MLRKTAGPTFPLSAFRYLRFACFSLFLWLKLFYKFRLCFGNNCSFNFTHAIPVKLRVYSLSLPCILCSRYLFVLLIRFSMNAALFFASRKANAQSFASRNSRKTLPFKTSHYSWLISLFHSSIFCSFRVSGNCRCWLSRQRKQHSGGLKWTRTTDLPLIRRAL